MSYASHTVLIPSSCGIFVYMLVTSIETRNACLFTLVLSMKYVKSVVSLRYDSCDFDIGWSSVSTKDDIFSVGPSQPEIIGLPVIVGL